MAGISEWSEFRAASVFASIMQSLMKCAVLIDAISVLEQQEARKCFLLWDKEHPLKILG